MKYISPVIQKETFDFLKDLAVNNNRDWFNNHKEEYEKAQQNVIAFANQLLGFTNKHDKIETPSGKKSLFRIYRDVRFSKDKSPYHAYWSGSFKRATKYLRGGYYFHIEPGNTHIVGGFWRPNANDMKLIRNHIAFNYRRWQSLVSGRYMKKIFGQLAGEKLISAPRGFKKNHPAIDLLRHKQFLLRRNFTDKEVLNPSFVYHVDGTFKWFRPFFDMMSELLTMDGNGISIVD